MMITESKKQLLRSREHMVQLIDRLQESIVHRCIIEGCIYGYKNVHKEPLRECLYCKNPRPVGVSPNAWRSEGQSVETMIEVQKEKGELLNQQSQIQKLWTKAKAFLTSFPWLS